MAELRVKETGTIKLFESDNTSSVTIASPASLGADRTITIPDADVDLGALGAALTGSTNNTVTTVTAANAIQGEANLQFDGTDLTVSTGDVIIGTSGKGIDFSATAGSGNSEILNDYEEGTWDASFVTGSGSISIRSDGTTQGYTKIGRMVHVQGAVIADTISTPSGALFIAGLPFAVDSSSGDFSDRSAGMCRTAALASTFTAIVWVVGGDTSLRVADAATSTDTEADHIADDSEIVFSIQYQAAEL